MKVAKRASFALLCGTVILLLFSASSRAFSIKPTGRLGDSLTFVFYTKQNDRLETRIVRFGIALRTGEGDWSPQWVLTGDQFLGEIRYGARYPGLKEMRVAEPLRKGVVYKAFASDLSTTGPSGYAVAYFSFAEDGTIVFNRAPEG